MTNPFPRNFLPTMLTVSAVMSISAACVLGLAGCSNEKPPPDPALMDLANTPSTPRDPAEFAGKWVGPVHTGRTRGRLEMIVEVDGDTFSGTLTSRTSDFTVRGTLLNSTYTGVVTKLSNTGKAIGSYDISGMWSPRGMTMNFEGGDIVGSRRGHGFLSKIEPEEK